MPNKAADLLYSHARDRGQRNQLWSALSGRSTRLFSLGEIAVASALCSQDRAGTSTVHICCIRGSESRSGDFDSDFNPLHDHNKGRWLTIAAARQRRMTLPPVALIQIGEIYFVRDGHHRISVARALGQMEIEATVEVWQVEGPLPWDEANQRQSLKPMRCLFRVERIMAPLRHIGRLLNGLGKALKRSAVSQPGVHGLRL